MRQQLLLLRGTSIRISERGLMMKLVGIYVCVVCAEEEAAGAGAGDRQGGWGHVQAEKRGEPRWCEKERRCSHILAMWSRGEQTEVVPHVGEARLSLHEARQDG